MCTKRITKLVYISIPTLMLLSGLILNPVTVSHEEASAATGTATAATTSLTLTTDNTSANVTITPNSANGTFAMSSTAGEAQFGVTTNNFTGYELSIVADDDSGNLVNIDGNVEHSIFSIDTPMTKSSFDANTHNNRWGYKPNKYMSNNAVIDNTGDSAVFLPSPTTTGTVLDRTTTPNTTANTYTIALGIRADHNTYAGTYSKTFTLVATANPITYTINYDKNTTDSVSNMPTTSTTGSTTSTSITLPSTIPTRAHYSFLGWCSTTTTTSNGTDSCSGTVYNPNGAGTNLTYGIDQTIANTTTLYAMWKLEKFTINLTISGGANEIIIDGVGYSGSSVSLAYGTHTISGSYNSGYEFGSWAASGSVSVASTSSATTTMTVNGAGVLTLNGKSRLFFQNATSAQCGQTMYDNRGTDAYKNIAYTTASINGRCWMTRNLDLPGGTTLTAADSNVTSNYTLPASSTSGFSNNSTAYVYNSNSTTCGGGSPCYSYYSYAAATAGTSPSSGVATSDICPKGWRLPTHAEYEALRYALGGNYPTGATLTASPFYGVYAGNYYNSSFLNGGSYGYYWSSTTNANVPFVFYLYFNSSSANTSDTNTKYLGFSVRCVLKASDISQISTMQDFATNNASAIKNSMVEGQAYTLKDSRDGTSYAVGKLADGNVWLLDNLALDLSTTRSLTTANTNITSDWTAPTNITTWVSAYEAPKINTESKNTTQSYGSGSGKIGVYYNYCAATAGTYCYASGSGTGNATSDICPKGWRMPTGGRSSEYQALYTAYSSNDTNFKNALRIPFSGSFNYDTVYYQGSEGGFWSSTYSDSNNMHNLFVSSSTVYPQRSNYRSYGLSVRCVLR